VEFDSRQRQHIQIRATHSVSTCGTYPRNKAALLPVSKFKMRGHINSATSCHDVVVIVLQGRCKVHRKYIYFLYCKVL